MSKIRGGKVIIDWHNTGYSILALRLGWFHPFIQIAKWLVRCFWYKRTLTTIYRFEGYFGRTAYAHLTVSKLMLKFLVEDWDIQYASFMLVPIMR